jgi:hypothetical protein
VSIRDSGCSLNRRIGLRSAVGANHQMPHCR